MSYLLILYLFVYFIDVYLIYNITLFLGVHYSYSVFFFFFFLDYTPFKVIMQ